MKIDDVPLNRYLVKHLQPLTEADPALLANYVVALLKNNKPKKDLQKLCIDQLFDFLGEGTKAFVLKLFNALEDGTISAFHEEPENSKPNDAATVPVSGDNAEPKSSPPRPEKVPSTNMRAFSDQEEEEEEEEEGTDDEDDDRNHKHRRRVSRSRSFDRDAQDEDERGPYRKRTRPTENGQPLRETDRPISELRRGSNLVHMEREGPANHDRRIRRDHGFSATGRMTLDGNLRGGTRGGPLFRGDGPGPRFDSQNGLSRGVLGRGRGAGTGPWAAHEQRYPPFDGSDFNQAMLPPGPPSSNLYPGRAMPSRGNPPHSPWGGYGHLPGMANGALDQTLPLNAGMQGARGVPISAAMGVGVNIGIGMALGRPRCPDFEERGYCLRGDLCPMEHGANRIVVEDVQSLSQFNLPVALPSGRTMAVGSVPVSGPSAVPFSSSLGLPSRAVRETNLSTLDDPSLSKGNLPGNAGTEPDLYDPDQPLWNKDRPDVADGMRRLPSFRKGQDESDWEGGAPDRRRGGTPDDGDPERYRRSTTSTSGGSQGMPSGQSVWDRIGPVDRGEGKAEAITRPANNSGESMHRMKVPTKEMTEDHEPHGRLGKWEGDIDGQEENSMRTPNMNTGKGRGVSSSQRGEAGARAVEGTSYASRGGGGRGITMSGTERAQRTLYVSCIPSNNNKKEVLLSHFQKFGDVMDVRIPAHSDRAFVQFSRREDAEAALMSPDAVMGNRFIRLSWANRDSIQDSSGEGNTSLPPNGRSIGGGSGPVVLTQTSLVKGKEKVVGGSSSFEPNTTESAGRLAGANGQPSPSVSLAQAQKKQEELEHMKEEIRRKQEELAQKRHDFRRKLERLSKQGVTMRGESEADQPSNKRPKLEEPEGAINGSRKLGTADVPILAPTAEKSLSSVEQSAAGSLKLLPGDASKQFPGLAQISAGTIPQPSPRVSRVPFPRPSVASTGSLGAPQWGPSRYKLDNRTTVFRILPPFPDGLLDIATLKEHFLNFGELLSVELEEADQKSDGCLTLTGKSVVRVAFGSRRAAEQAFVQGRWFQGTSLQVVWVNPAIISGGGVTPTVGKHVDGTSENTTVHHPRSSFSGAILAEKEDQEDGKLMNRDNCRIQDKVAVENFVGEEDVQSTRRVADESLQLRQGQVLTTRSQSDVSTRLDGADVDSPGIYRQAASVQTVL